MQSGVLAYRRDGRFANRPYDNAGASKSSGFLPSQERRLGLARHYADFPVVAGLQQGGEGVASAAQLVTAALVAVDDRRDVGDLAPIGLGGGDGLEEGAAGAAGVVDDDDAGARASAAPR